MSRREHGQRKVATAVVPSPPAVWKGWLVWAIALSALLVVGTGCVSAPQAQPEPSPTAQLSPTTPAAVEPSPTPTTPMPEEPAATPEPEPGVIETPEPIETPAVAEGLCPQVPRPALLLDPSAGGRPSLTLTSMDGEVSCDLALAAPLRGRVAGAAGSIFYSISDGDIARVMQLAPDETNRSLDFTETDTGGSGILPLVVSPDGGKIAWGTQRPVGPGQFANDLWVADIDGSNRVTLLEGALDGGQIRVVQPIAFSPDNSTLFFALQHDSHAPVWTLVTGRYGNLYRVPVSGGEPELIFDCAGVGPTHCIGDLAPDATMFAYTDSNQRLITVRGVDADVIATLTPPEREYLSPAFFGPEGNLIFTSARLADAAGFPVAAPGILSRAPAPYSGTPETILSLDGISVPAAWLNGDHVVLFYLPDAQTMSLAVVPLEGDEEPVLIPVQSMAEFVGVLR
jgi:hypothetical protein